MKQSTKERDIVSPTDIIIMQLVYHGSVRQMSYVRDIIDDLDGKMLGPLANTVNEYQAQLREQPVQSLSLIGLLDHILAETIDRMAFIINPAKDADEPF